MQFMTAITRAAFQGKTAERDMSDKRGLAKRKRDRAKTSEPPRTRDGKTFPGGRTLRRRLKNLSARQAAFVAKVDRTKPGSMKG